MTDPQIDGDASAAGADVSWEGVTRVHPGRRGGEDVIAVEDLHLHADAGELLVLVGPSGSGKSTALRVLAGLEPISAGTVRLGGRDVTDLAPAQRDVAMVFQDLALFPHLSVAENIVFGARTRGMDASGREALLAEVTVPLELDGLLHRRPDELSGGQRQRVALARALARHPSVFLLDEPLSNLDARLRIDARARIVTLQRSLGTTMVFVTHDQVEAMTMGDRIAVLRDGRLEQGGTPRELYDNPATTFVAGFLGTPPMNLLPADGPLASGPAGGTVGLRAEDLVLDAGAPDRDVTGQVVLVEDLGSEKIIRVTTPIGDLDVRVEPRRAISTGERVTVGVAEDAHIHRFGADGRRV